MNDQYSSLAPEAMQAVMNTGDNDPEMVLLKQRQARADALRRAGMQNVDAGHMAGRTYIPNLGGMAMQAAQMYRANQMQPELDQATQATMGRTNAARSQYAAKLIDALRRRGPTMGTPQMAGAGEPDQDEYMGGP